MELPFGIIMTGVGTISLATILTLVVMPTLYSFVYTGNIAAERGIKWLQKAY